MKQKRDKAKQTSAQNAAFRQAVNRAAFQRGEWAGCPVPVDGMSMVIARGYPFADIFKRQLEPQSDRVVNSWYSTKYHADVGSVQDKDGQYHAAIGPRENRAATSMFDTFRAAATWDFDAEVRAMDKLQGLIPEHLFAAYCLTGMFIETSKHSGVCYIFRRLRPTAACSMTGKTWDWGKRELVESQVRFLCALCLHPIGYYEGSWAGAMVPTDDVLAHLLLMRADEKFYWRKANQIPCYKPEAGMF